jgi:hypothetical protein
MMYRRKRPLHSRDALLELIAAQPAGSAKRG